MVALAFFACKTAEKKNEDEKHPDPILNSRMYTDIDPFTLTGVDEIKDRSAYPYITIENSTGKKRIVYMITPKDSVVRIYKEWESAMFKEGKAYSAWVTDYSGGDSLQTTELLYPDIGLEFTYVRPEKKLVYLLKGVFIEQDTSTTYFTDKDPRFCPDASIAAIDNVKYKSETVVTEKMEVTRDKLRITVSNFSKKENKITYTDTSCFSGGKRSWLWFRHFAPKAIPCK